MLQQTQVARVLEKYDAFLARFPTLTALATAAEADVLALWSGLGYYNRARNLQRAARQIAAEHGGRVPRDVKSLRRLAGVGPYTAGAIASLVFGEAEPIVDGNIARVLSRLEARAEAPDANGSAKWAWRRAGELVATASDPATFNEGLMELGALICTPAAPRCGRCPLSRRCEARKKGLQEEIPLPRRAPRRHTLYCASLLLIRGDAVRLQQRPAAGMWAGMWQAPTLESEAPIAAAAVRAALIRARGGRLRKLLAFAHPTTHRAAEFTVYRLCGCTAEPPGQWVRWSELQRYALSSAQRRVLKCAAEAPDGW